MLNPSIPAIQRGRPAPFDKGRHFAVSPTCSLKISTSGVARTAP